MKRKKVMRKKKKVRNKLRNKPKKTLAKENKLNKRKKKVKINMPSSGNHLVKILSWELLKMLAIEAN